LPPTNNTLPTAPDAFAPSNAADILRAAVSLLDAGQPFALATIIRTQGATPRKEGSRMIVQPGGKITGSIGGAAVELLAVEKAQTALTTGSIEHLELNLDDIEGESTGMVCGGRVELLIEPFGTSPRLLLFGAGHVAQAAARLAGEIGFSVVVHDERPEWANAERFPRAQITLGQVETLAKSAVTTANDFIAVMTHCHSEDLKVVRCLLNQPFFYLGVIGSKHKAMEIKQILSNEGWSSAQLQRLTCPIGFDIGSHTPAEIAIAIAAQLIAERSRWIIKTGSNNGSFNK